MSSKGGAAVLGIFAGIAALAALAASAYVYKDEISELIQSENETKLGRVSVALGNLERQIGELDAKVGESATKSAGFFKKAVTACAVDVDYLYHVLDNEVKKEAATEVQRKSLVLKLNALADRMDRYSNTNFTIHMLPQKYSHTHTHTKHTHTRNNTNI